MNTKSKFKRFKPRAFIFFIVLSVLFGVIQQGFIINPVFSQGTPFSKKPALDGSVQYDPSQFTRSIRGVIGGLIDPSPPVSPCEWAKSEAKLSSFLTPAWVDTAQCEVGADCCLKVKYPDPPTATVVPPALDPSKLFSQLHAQLIIDSAVNYCEDGLCLYYPGDPQRNVEGACVRLTENCGSQSTQCQASVCKQFDEVDGNGNHSIFTDCDNLSVAEGTTCDAPAGADPCNNYACDGQGSCGLSSVDPTCNPVITPPQTPVPGTTTPPATTPEPFVLQGGGGCSLRK